MHGEMTANPRAGLMTLVTQVNKAMNKRASEELLGMRLKQFLTLSYIQDHENVTQQALETALLVDANAVVLLLNAPPCRGDPRGKGRAGARGQGANRPGRRDAGRLQPAGARDVAKPAAEGA